MGRHAKDPDAEIPADGWVRDQPAGELPLKAPEPPPTTPIPAASSTPPAPAAPIESKVKQPTLAVGGVSVVLGGIVGTILDQPGIVEALPLPPWAIGLILAVLPPIAAAYFGYRAPHTPRPDDSAGPTPSGGDNSG